MELRKQTEEGKETEMDLLDKRVQKGEKGAPTLCGLGEVAWSLWAPLSGGDNRPALSLLILGKIKEGEE